MRCSISFSETAKYRFSEAEQEMLAAIQSENRTGLRTTLQSLVRHFEHKPYGWYLAAIQCILAKLIARGKVEVQRDSNILEGDELERALQNTHGYTNLILQPQIDFTPAQVRHLKEFYSEFFDRPPLANEAKGLGKETAEALYALLDDLAEQQQQSGRYPFLGALDEPISKLGEVTGKSYTFYLTELRTYEDRLLDAKEGVIDPIFRFMSGSQRQIYDEARQYLETQEPNFSHVKGDEAAEIKLLMDDPACYNGNRMMQVKSLLSELRSKVESKVLTEKEQAVRAIDERWERLTGMAEFGDLTPKQRLQLQESFVQVKQTIDRQFLIAVITDTLFSFDNNQYSDLLHRMTTWAQAASRGTPEGEYPPIGGGDSPLGETKVEYVPKSAISVSFKRAWLADEADVDTYLKALKQAMMQVINNGKRVQI